MRGALIPLNPQFSAGANHPLLPTIIDIAVTYGLKKRDLQSGLLTAETLRRGTLAGKTPTSILCIILCFAGALLIAGCASAPGPELTEATQYPRAPDTSFEYMDGSTNSLADYLGKSVVLVNFWGLRCQNCIEEMPFLERLHNKYGSRGLVILGINTDGVDSALLEKFMPQLPVKVSYPIVIDPEFALADAYQMMAAPLTVVIAKDGTVRYRHEGYEPDIEGVYIRLIEELL